MNDGSRRPADRADDSGPDAPDRPHTDRDTAATEVLASVLVGRADGGDGGDDGAPAGAGDDELALRRLLREAVQDVRPAEGTLDHLRRAVPARRARKRQAVVGMVAAGVFIGMAVPALVHVTKSGGSSGDRPSIAGLGQATEGGSDSGKGGGGASKGADSSPDRSKSEEKSDKKERPSDKGKESGGGATGGPDPASTAAASSPTCAAADLSAVSASAGQADAEGKVYGSFRVANISAATCTVDSGGSVVAVAQGAADPARIGVVDHTAGDAAALLPAPSAQPGRVILAPGTSYEVKFAWVPSGPCPTTGGGTGGTGGSGGGGGGGESSPSPSPTEGSGGGTEDTPAAVEGVTTQLGSDEGVAAGSVSLSHTAGPGAPSVGTTIPNACAGTVYRTGVLPAS